MTTKQCFKCLEVRPTSDFYTHPRMADGHLGKCKPCVRAYSREVDPVRRAANDRNRTSRATKPIVEATTARPGDLFVLGRHRLLCGDSTKPADMKRLMGGDVASLLWTDPPYNIAMLDDDARQGESFRAFLVDAFTACDAVMSPGAVFYIAAPAGPTLLDFQLAVRELSWRHSQTLVWVKDQFALGHSDFHCRHEHMVYGWKLGAAHHRVTDRAQDTVWEYPRPKLRGVHPTMKPVELIERAITNSSTSGAIVLDAFGGSGSTLIAAERTGRCARVMEIEPRYVDAIVRRWEKVTGEKVEPLASPRSASLASPSRRLRSCRPSGA